VKQFGESSDASANIAAVPLPAEDRAVRAPDAAAIGIVPAVAGTVAGTVAGLGGTVGALTETVGGLVGGLTGSSSGEGSGSGEDSSGSGSSGSGSGKSASTVAAAGKTAAAERTATVAETVVNGATFPIDPTDGRPVIAFSERGVAVDPANPTAWGSGAGAIYLTDGEATVYAAVVGPLGEVQLRVFDAGSAGWR
jgi:hypothetical protein